MAVGLESVEHIVVLMLENRSFDNLLGYLYTDQNNTSPAGDPFEGLTGAETCPDGNGADVAVSKVDPAQQYAYLNPWADPGEGYAATNQQLFATATPAAGAPASMTGFVTDYAATITLDASRGWYAVPGVAADQIMACYPPQMLPVLSGLAKGFAVCDHWYASVPTQTLPNRAFVCAATSHGYMDDKTKTYPVPSIFGALTHHHKSWRIYGYTSQPLTRLNFPDTVHVPARHIGLFTDFQAQAAAGTLPSYAFLEPSWGAAGNSQHPNYDVARGEQLILDTYRALRDGPDWDTTLLIVTYDEHGGCYDHVPPPSGATPPDGTSGEFGFDFTRFGPRVPTVLVSPLIPAGTVFRVPDGSTPLDHTSILATVEKRWAIPALTARDAAAPTIAAALSLTEPRTDDPLAGVEAPPPTDLPPGLTARTSHLNKVTAELLSPTRDRRRRHTPTRRPRRPRPSPRLHPRPHRPRTNCSVVRRRVRPSRLGATGSTDAPGDPRLAQPGRLRLAKSVSVVRTTVPLLARAAGRRIGSAAGPLAQRRRCTGARRLGRDAPGETPSEIPIGQRSITPHRTTIARRARTCRSCSTASRFPPIERRSEFSTTLTHER